jgi:Ribonuclease G/E
MTLAIRAACSPGEVRVALLDADALIDFGIWRPGLPDGVGDVLRGRVTAKVAGMAGTFLDLDGAAGFLPDSEGGADLREGDIVAVRITRAAQGGKGPRLTARLAADEIPPAHGDGVLVELARRHPTAPVMIDDSAMAARLKAALGDRLELVAQAFDDVIEEQIEELGQPDVELSDGGRLHIHPTPALVAIDIDAGAAIATSRRGKAASHLAANLQMLPGLVRQIRLRNLSGAILVDFAGLPARRRAALGPELRAALALDPLTSRLLGFTALGLAEIVRLRVHPPLHELLAGPHAAGLAALRHIAAEVTSQPHRPPVLRASPAIVTALKADTEALRDLARRAGRPLIMHSDPALPLTGWVIEAQL